MVSEVIFPRFWGVVCIEKCFRNFEIVIGSAVSEISRFAQFYVNFGYTRKSATGSFQNHIFLPQRLFFSLAKTPSVPDRDRVSYGQINFVLNVLYKIN